MSRFRTLLAIKKRQLNRNDLRQCLRIAFGSGLGFFISKWMGWDNGVFFTMTPVLLLALVPNLNRNIVLQFCGNILLVTFAVGVIYGLFGNNPVAITLLVFVLFTLLFRLMSRGPLFLFGAMSAVNLSITLHFASYSSSASDAIHIGDMLVTNIIAGGLSVLIAVSMHLLFPDLEPRPARPTVRKPLSNQRHESLLAATVATLSFVAFQVLDLRDSLSAQLATILILFPLNWKGAGPAGWNRSLGTLVGCSFALLVQLLLLNHASHLPLVTFALWLGMLLFARYHMLEGGQSAGGFSAMSSLAVLFSQYLTPTQDIVMSALYRFTSLAIAVLATLCVVFLMDRLLNRFESTSLQPIA